MILNHLPLLSDRNASEGLHIPLVYANDVTGGVLVQGVLFAFFLCLFIGAAVSQRRTTGFVNWAGCFAVSSFLTFGASVIAKIIPGLVSTNTWIIWAAMTVLGGAFLLFSDRGRL